MKKFLKMAICLLMAIGIVACSGGSTEKQEAVVTNFFEYLKAGDMDKISTICTEDNSDVEDLISSISQTDEFQDVDTYGQTFVDEFNKYMKAILSDFIVSYEIESVEEDGENYVVTTNAEIKNYDNVNFEDILTKILTDYQKEHIDELKTYESEDEMIKKAFSDIAPTAFEEITKECKAVKDSEEYQIKFTLVSDGDNWLISKIE